MSNVCGLRKCWSVGLFSNKQEDHGASTVHLSNSLQNLHTLCVSAPSNQSISFLIKHQDDVEETIYLNKRTNGGFKTFNVHYNIKKTEAFALSSTNNLEEIELSQLKIETGPTSFVLQKSENEKSETLQTKRTMEQSESMFLKSESQIEQPHKNSICHFEILPDELALQILSYIPLKELYVNIPLVCKTWKSFALSPILWQHLDLEETKYLSPKCLIEIICKNCSLLKRLNLRCNDSLDDYAMTAIAKACPLLQELTLPFCGDVNTTLKIFIQYCTSLQYLNMEGSNVTDSILQQLATLPLKGLNVSHCVRLTDNALKFVTSHCSRLVAVNFDGVQWITDDAILTMVRHCYQTLEKLWLDGDNLTDASVSAISKCKNLKVFSISFCENLTDETLMSVQNMKKLYSLRLRKGDKFTTIGFIQLFIDLDVHFMENKSGLQFLAIPECVSLEDEALKVLAKSCPNLIHLDLSWCWNITDQGLGHVIEKCPRMEKMTICGLTDIQGECLLHLPKRMPYLRYLDASQCNSMSDDILYELIDTVPEMIIIDYYSEILQPHSGSKHS